MPGPYLVVALALSLGGAAGEVYRVAEEEVAPFTLAAKHLFYVDASGHRPGREEDEAQGFFEGEAQVLFQGFRVTTSKLLSQGDEPWSLYAGLLPWEDFDRIVDKASFCDAQGGVTFKKDVQKTDPKLLRVPFGTTVTRQMKIAQTGVYVAFLANCGDGDDLQISGKISVKGSSGFLPANRQSSLTLFGWCLALYIIAGVVWVALLAGNKEDLHEPHYAIASFIAFGVGEAVCYWRYLSEVDDTGEASAWLLTLCQGMSVMKTVFMFVVIMLLCFGVGLTTAEDSNVSWKLLGVAPLLSAALAPKVFFFDHRHTKSLSDGDIILPMILAILATLVTIAWALMGFSRTMNRCKDFNYDEAVKLLQRLVVLAVVLVLLAAGILAAQVLDKPGRGAMWWRYHALWGDTAGEAVHLVALVCLMILCQPGQAAFRSDDSEAQAAAHEERVGIVDLEETQDEAKMSSPRADAIGAPTSE